MQAVATGARHLRRDGRAQLRGIEGRALIRIGRADQVRQPGFEREPAHAGHLLARDCNHETPLPARERRRLYRPGRILIVPMAFWPYRGRYGHECLQVGGHAASVAGCPRQAANWSAHLARAFAR